MKKIGCKTGLFYLNSDFTCNFIRLLMFCVLMGYVGL